MALLDRLGYGTRRRGGNHLPADSAALGEAEGSPPFGVWWFALANVLAFRKTLGGARVSAGGNVIPTANSLPSIAQNAFAVSQAKAYNESERRTGDERKK